MIQFDSQKHVYSNQGQLYISATTLIKRYSNGFDAEFMATYKALKDVLLQEKGDRYWREYKWKAGGKGNSDAWRETVPYFRATADMSHPLAILILARKEWYIKEWERVGREASERGTAVHEEKEKEIKQKDCITASFAGEKVVLMVSQDRILPVQEFNSDKVYTELILSNDRFLIAGMVDKTEKFGRVVHLSDYKTYKEVKMEGFANQMMRPPLQEVPDCNYYHAQLQLSLYAWMFEQLGYIVGSLSMIHLFGPDCKLEQHYPLIYKKVLIEQMIEHYSANQ